MSPETKQSLELVKKYGETVTAEINQMLSGTKVARDQVQAILSGFKGAAANQHIAMMQLQMNVATEIARDVNQLAINFSTAAGKIQDKVFEDQDLLKNLSGKFSVLTKTSV
ncbi:MAG: hypothetical protein ACRC35_02220 [Angustibacter sp.]